ncbi:CRISPR-associated protein [Dehalococcoidia bacterium]|nr:CRISPR-associated protein [Dehalococcoidia bacterium]MCL0102568.1 CRISPR-associated protein [Dehalococcoidia bacterium]
MIDAMRTLALDYLFGKLGDTKSPPKNLDDWYHELCTSHSEKLFPFLVESVEGIKEGDKVYILEQDIDKDTVRLVPEDAEKNIRWLPFMKPTGSQSAQIGPVIKRTYSKGKGAGPTAKILKTTMESFTIISCANKLWSGYFGEIASLLESPELKLLDNSVINWKEYGYENLLIAAVDKIGEQKTTVFLTIRDSQGRFPGQRPEYRNYLMTEKLGGTRYTTGEALPKDNQTCPLCHASPVTVFPNALRGAGINLSNVDRVGAFPGIDMTQAWKRYPLCVACANLLYIYKFHVLKKDSTGRNPYITSIAGDSALVIPFTTVDYNSRHSIWRKVKDFVKSSSSDVEEDEASLLDLLKDEKGILNLTFLWATVGQNIENVSGMITNVPPTRLVQLSKINDESRNWQHPLFPEIRYFQDKKVNFRPDLSLRALRTLFYRPGRKKAKDANASMKLKQLSRNIAASVYHKEQIPESRFWEEIMITAGWYWLNAIEKGKGGENNLLYEGKNTKTGEHYLTCAGWIRHLCWWIYYFKRLEVLKMEDKFYEPAMENLKPYFGQESGINSPQKAFAFLLGVLYGKVLQVQGAKGVNVGANALTWLKRLTLKGRDLPELYIKTRQKLLTYETEKSSDVRELIREIGLLGIQLGDNIELEEIATNYYLLLGQSMTTTILP